MCQVSLRNLNLADIVYSPFSDFVWIFDFVLFTVYQLFYFFSPEMLYYV